MAEARQRYGDIGFGAANAGIELRRLQHQLARRGGQAEQELSETDNSIFHTRMLQTAPARRNAENRQRSQ